MKRLCAALLFALLCCPLPALAQGALPADGRDVFFGLDLYRTAEQAEAAGFEVQPNGVAAIEDDGAPDIDPDRVICCGYYTILEHKCFVTISLPKSEQEQARLTLFFGISLYEANRTLEQLVQEIERKWGAHTDSGYLDSDFNAVERAPGDPPGTDELRYFREWQPDAANSLTLLLEPSRDKLTVWVMIAGRPIAAH